MNDVVAGKEKAFKVDIDPELQQRVVRAYEEHGANLKTGTSRLFEFFVEAGPELRVLILSRNLGRVPELLAREILRLAEEKGAAPVTFAGVVLDRSARRKPEQAPRDGAKRGK